MTKEEMWERYLQVNPRADKYDAWAFGGTTSDIPNILADLVLTGKKTATTGAYPCYEFENVSLPPVDGYNIILNTENEAVCITKTTKVYVVPFCDVTVDHAYKEGEGDCSLRYWQECHKKFFMQELDEIGQEFTTDMLVVCEEFEVVYPEKDVM